MSPSPTANKQTDILDTWLSRIENAPKFKVQAYMAQHFRVEFTLAKLQKSIDTSRAETNYSCSQNCTHKQRKYLIFTNNWAR